MADLIAFHNYYSRHSLLSPSTMIPRPSNHKRSLSSGHGSPSPDKSITKAKSVNDLTVITADNTTGEKTDVAGYPESSFSTLKDPRIANGSDGSDSSSSPSHHPDLNDEVAALSLKLVQAINNQTSLDDTLVATRQELEQARTQISALELENEKYRRDIDEEVVVKKADTDVEIAGLKAALEQEKAERSQIEKGKKTIEQELETLTAALFEEANKMVAAAKLEREAVEKKNEQLRSQVKDTELLLASHQDQMAELKSVIQAMNAAKEEADIRTTTSTAPSSPDGPRQLPGIVKRLEIPEASETTPCPDELLPGPSTSFPHLIKPVCRTDGQAYEDFRELFSMANSSKPPSRAASGSYGGLNVMSLASLSGAGFGSSFGSASSSPAKSQPHSPSGSMSSPHPSTSHIPLKDSRFYKRALTEDIEPTLRLDIAPGISWLTRRTVLSGICEGSLLVEPMPTSLKKFEFPCSLCGERRPGADKERTHRFRTSDSETAQRYPLCVLCLEKVRSSCEFTGYLRLILDGHLRAGDVEEEKDAWEETVRLRERMFWSRIGAGVVPLFNQVSSPEEARSNKAQTEHFDEPQQFVPTNLDLQTEKDVDIDDDDASVYDDAFVSAGSESPASSAADSMQFDEIEQHSLDADKDETHEQAVEHEQDSMQIHGDENPNTTHHTDESLASQAAVQSDGHEKTVETDEKAHQQS